MSSTPNKAKTTDFIKANTEIVAPITGTKNVNTKGKIAKPIIIEGAALSIEPPGILSSRKVII